MLFRDLVMRYQAYDPTTGEFTARRTQDQYARLLGVSAPTITRLRHGDITFSISAARGLARAFPEVRDELATVMLAHELVA
jgi:predicted transcriptional regulator